MTLKKKLPNKRIVFLIVDNGMDGRSPTSEVFASYDEETRDRIFNTSQNKNYYRKEEKIVDVRDIENTWKKLTATEQLLLLDPGCILWQSTYVGHKGDNPEKKRPRTSDGRRSVFPKDEDGAP